MANVYTTVEAFKAWVPQRYLAELTDDTGGVTVDDELVDDGLDDAVAELESGLMVRDDIPIPAINADNTVPKRIIKFIFDVALYNILSRRTAENETVTRNYDIQMTWLDQIVRRQKNIDIRNSSNVEVTKTVDLPVTGGERSTRKFDDFSF